MRPALVLVLLISLVSQAQEEFGKSHYWDLQWYGGSILEHNKDITHLIQEHPWGLIAAYNQETFGNRYWQEVFGYPDWGVSMIYQDFGYEPLGQNIGLYGHLNFYFFQRHVQFRVGQGIAYNTNPFDLDDNFKNIAYGSALMSSTYFLLNFQKKELVEGLGAQFGLSFIHHSNGNFKSPNTSTNVLALNIGLLYDTDVAAERKYKSWEPQDFREPIHFNLVLRGGLNESDYLNLGQHPFMVLSAYADKRLGVTSSLQLGAEYFYSETLLKEIEYLEAAFPSLVDGSENGSRVGLFAGHELHLGSLAIPTQIGYYLYWPYEFEERFYLRAGLKYYITSKWFAVATLKAHGAKAEGIEFGIGYRI